MNDYYSEFPQPNKEVRKIHIISSLKSEDTNNLKTKDINDIIDKVVSEAPEFSQSGYAVFGKNQALNSVKSLLKERQINIAKHT